MSRLPASLKAKTLRTFCWVGLFPTALIQVMALCSQVLLPTNAIAGPVANTPSAGLKSSPVTLLDWQSEPGNYPGRGLKETFIPENGTFSFTPYKSGNVVTGVDVSFIKPNGTYFRVTLDAPGSTPLSKGSFKDAIRYPFNGATKNGISATSTGRGCNTVIGEFDIEEFKVDPATGNILSMAATFSHYCEQNQPTNLLKGVILYNYEKPESVTLLDWQSEPGNFPGRGYKGVFSPTNGKFTFTPRKVGNVVTGVEVYFDRNDGTYFRVELDAKGNSALEKGSYNNAIRYPFNGNDQHGIGVSSTGRACNTVQGDFNVAEIKVDPVSGKLTSFAATFNHYCEQKKPENLLKGTILYNYTIPKDYCTPVTKSAAFESIGGVKVGNFEYTTGFTTRPFEDFSRLTPPGAMTLLPGSEVNFKLTPAFTTSAKYPENWRVWIDVNGDGDFGDSNELLYSSVKASPDPVVGKFTVPPGIVESTRMRVRMSWDSSQMGPCDSVSYGQTEDYQVVKGENSKNVLLDFEEYAHTGNVVRFQVYKKAGYTISVPDAKSDQFGVMGPQSGIRYAGSATLQSMWIPSTITLSKDDGAPFELTSADLTKYWNGVQNNQVTFVGFKANGGTVSKTISLNEFILRTHNFASSGFTNLTKVEWTVYGNGSSSHQIDNIRLKVQ